MFANILKLYSICLSIFFRVFFIEKKLRILMFNLVFLLWTMLLVSCLKTLHLAHGPRDFLCLNSKRFLVLHLNPQFWINYYTKCEAWMEAHWFTKGHAVAPYTTGKKAIYLSSIKLLSQLWQKSFAYTCVSLFLVFYFVLWICVFITLPVSQYFDYWGYIVNLKIGWMSPPTVFYFSSFNFPFKCQNKLGLNL